VPPVTTLCAHGQRTTFCCSGLCGGVQPHEAAAYFKIAYQRGTAELRTSAASWCDAMGKLERVLEPDI
jgi:hypothetical protein